MVNRSVGYTDEKKFTEDRKMNEIDILRKMQKNFMPLIIFTLLLKHLFHGNFKYVLAEVREFSLCFLKSTNPLTPMSDQDRISPYNINTISTR